MFILHCTKKAQLRLKVSQSASLPEPTTRLGNWYCNEFTFSRHRYLIFVNEQTVMPIVISLKGLKDSGYILDFFRQRLFKTFLRMNLPEQSFMPELLEMHDVYYANTQNRRIVGYMNDLISQAKFLADYHQIEPDSMAMFEILSDVPYKSNDYQKSTKLASQLLSR